MEPFTKKIESLRNIRLSDNEKAEMFSHIQERISSDLSKPVPSPYTNFNVWTFAQRHSMYATAVAILLVLAGGSAAAETALPGDLLYPIKRSINEGVMEVFAFDDESKVNVKIKLVERRFEEAGKIIAENTEDEAMLTALAVDIQEHARGALDHIEDIRNQDSIITAAELSNELGTTIDAHDSYIDSLTETPDIAVSARMTMMFSLTEQTSNASHAAPSLQTVIDQTKVQVNAASNNLSNIIASSETELITDSELIENKEQLREMLDNPDITKQTKIEVEMLVEAAEENIKNDNNNDAFIVLQQAEILGETQIKKTVLQNEFGIQTADLVPPNISPEETSTTTATTTSPKQNDL